MKITAAELKELGLWNRFCDDTGMNPWALNEGLLDRDLELEWNVIKKSEAKENK